MGMQAHFQVADIPGYIRFKKISHQHEKGTPDEYWDHYVALEDRGGFTFSTDEKHESAWFDIGSMADYQMARLRWLIGNRIPFHCS